MDLVIGGLLLVSFCLVMYWSLMSFLRAPIGWYRGFQSAPVFQIAMWIGALPLLLPAIVLFLYRRRSLQSARFIGNLRSRIYHEPDCEYQHRIRSNFLRYPLDSAEDAAIRRFRPCNWCRPRGR